MSQRNKGSLAKKQKPLLVTTITKTGTTLELSAPISPLPPAAHATHVLPLSLSLFFFFQQEEDSDDEDAPAAKKSKVAGGSKPVPKKKKTKKKSGDDSNDEDSVNSDVVEDLSGDEVDTSNIIQGGRRTRRGRPTSFASAQYAATNDDSDSDED